MNPQSQSHPHYHQYECNDLFGGVEDDYDEIACEHHDWYTVYDGRVSHECGLSA